MTPIRLRVLVMFRVGPGMAHPREHFFQHAPCLRQKWLDLCEMGENFVHTIQKSIHLSKSRVIRERCV